MNHYERLKVAPDAPPEVIRAAYRALAAKLHPDRKGGDAGPTEQAHEAMAALNASYLVLMDPAAREAYDRSLESDRAASSAQGPEPEDSRSGFMNSRFWNPMAGRSREDRASQMSGQETEAGDTRVDIDWLSQSPSSNVPWFRDSRWLMPGVIAATVLLGAVMWWGLQVAERVAFDETLARRDAQQLASKPMPVEQAPQLASVRASTSQVANPSVPALSPEQMARLSNDELLALMPELMADDAATSGASGEASLLNPSARGSHPLDGQPLGLKIAPQLPAVMAPAANEP